MKLRFYYFQEDGGNAVYGDTHDLWWSCDTGEPRKDEWFAIDTKFQPEESGKIALARPYSTYLCSALSTDFPEYDPTFVDDVLEQVERIERGEIDAYEYEGDGFTQYITRDGVRFEHTVFGECPEWPIWYCTFAQYKAALQGYRRFLDMPKSIESELIVELPEN